MKRLLSQINPDQVGAWSAGLCLLHCTIFPILIAASTGSAHTSELYHDLEYVFLVIGLFALWHAIRSAASRAIAWALTAAYTVMLGAIGLEAITHIHLHFLVYLASVGLIILHIINYRQCRRCTVHTK